MVGPNVYWTTLRTSCGHDAVRCPFFDSLSPDLSPSWQRVNKSTPHGRSSQAAPGPDAAPLTRPGRLCCPCLLRPAPWPCWCCAGAAAAGKWALPFAGAEASAGAGSSLARGTGVDGHAGCRRLASATNLTIVGSCSICQICLIQREGMNNFILPAASAVVTCNVATEELTLVSLDIRMSELLLARCEPRR